MNKWHRYQILDSDIGNVGHYLTIQSGSQKDEVRFCDVRGGIAWATDLSPFCIVIVGQDFFDEKLYYDKSPSFTLIFEATDRGLDLERRFNELADIAELYKCDLFADLSPLHEPEQDAWYDYHSAKGLTYGDLLPAPWSDNFRLGIELCKTSVRKHKLSITKDTEAFLQLSRITEKDLGDKDVKARYFAIEALRHLMAAFKRDPADHPNINVAEHTSAGGQGWMF